MDTESLTDLARELLSGELSEEELIAGYERYSDGMDRWLESTLKSMERGVGAPAGADAQELLALHQEVLERAKDLKDSVRKELLELKAKGKGLMAYTDQLPKRVSTRKGTKS